MNIRRLIARNREKDRRGANAIEFALTAPMLFFLILATMDFGWYFAHLLILESSTVHAARVASLGAEESVVKAQLAAKWAQSGLPGEIDHTSGTMTRTSTDTTTLVTVTGAVGYDSFGGWDKLLGDLEVGLPDTITVTVTRRMEAQGASAGSGN